MTLNPPIIGVDVGERRLQIDTGELLFPAIALCFAALYYWDTRGLPGQSMIYAEPLLYSVVLFAVIVIFQHGVSISSSDGEVDEAISGSEPIDSEATEAEPEDGEDPSPSTEGDEETTPYFNARSATGLAALTLVYIGLLFVEVPFLYTTPAFLATSLFMFGERNPIRFVAYTVGFTALVWYVFISWLNIPLP